MDGYASRPFKTIEDLMDIHPEIVEYIKKQINTNMPEYKDILETNVETKYYVLNDNIMFTILDSAIR